MDTVDNDNNVFLPDNSSTQVPLAGVNSGGSSNTPLGNHFIVSLHINSQGQPRHFSFS